MISSLDEQNSHEIREEIMKRWKLIGFPEAPVDKFMEDLSDLINADKDGINGPIKWPKISIPGKNDLKDESDGQ